MNLEYLDAQLTRFVRDAGSDPEHPSPSAAWRALLRLASAPLSIEDLGEDFVRFEAVMTGAGSVAILITRELTQPREICGVLLATALRSPAGQHESAAVEVLIESATEPEYLPLNEFAARVQATPAFKLLLASGPPQRSLRLSEVNEG